MGKVSKSKRTKAKRQRRLAAQAALPTGAGSRVANDLIAPEGYQREHVLDVDGRPATVIRRIDNMMSLRRVIGPERVNGLICLRMATEAMERGLAPRCGLDMSPGAGPDGFISLIQHRIEAARTAGEMWSFVKPGQEMTVRLVVLQGASIEVAAQARAQRMADARASVKTDLEAVADAINCYLDRRFGAPRMKAA